MSRPTVDKTTFPEIKALILDDRISMSDVRNHVEHELAERRKALSASAAAENKRHAEQNNNNNKSDDAPGEDISTVVAELGIRASRRSKGGGSDSTGEQVEKLRGWKPVTISDPSGTHSVILADVNKPGMSRVERIYVEDRRPRYRKRLLTPRDVRESEEALREKRRMARQNELANAFKEMSTTLVTVTSPPQDQGFLQHHNNSNNQRNNSNNQQQNAQLAEFLPIRSVVTSVVATPPLPLGWRKLSDMKEEQRIKKQSGSLGVVMRGVGAPTAAAGGSSSSEDDDYGGDKEERERRAALRHALAEAARKARQREKEKQQQQFEQQQQLEQQQKQDKDKGNDDDPDRPKTPVWHPLIDGVASPPPAAVVAGGALSISRRLRQLRNEAAHQSALALGGSTHQKAQLLERTEHMTAKIRRDMTVGALTMIGNTHTYKSIQSEKNKKRQLRIEQQRKEQQLQQQQQQLPRLGSASKSFDRRSLVIPRRESFRDSATISESGASTSENFNNFQNFALMSTFSNNFADSAQQNLAIAIHDQQKLRQQQLPFASKPGKPIPWQGTCAQFIEHIATSIAPLLGGADQVARTCFSIVEYGAVDFNHKQRHVVESYPWQHEGNVEPILQLLREMLEHNDDQDEDDEKKAAGNNKGEEADLGDVLTQNFNSSITLSASMGRMLADSIFARRFADGSKKLGSWVARVRRALDRALGPLETPAEDDRLEEMDAVAARVAANQGFAAHQTHHAHSHSHSSSASPHASLSGTASGLNTTSSSQLQHQPLSKSDEVRTTPNGAILLTKEEKKLLVHDVFGGAANNSSSGNNNNSSEQTGDVVTKQQGLASMAAAQRLGLLEPVMRQLPNSFLFSRAADVIIRGFAGVDLGSAGAGAGGDREDAKKEQQQQKSSEQKGGGDDGDGSATAAVMAATSAEDSEFLRFMELTRGTEAERKQLQTEENFGRGIVMKARATLERIKVRQEAARGNARQRLFDQLEERRKAAESVLSHRRGGGNSTVSSVAHEAERRAKVWRLLRMPPEMARTPSPQQQQNQQGDGGFRSHTPGVGGGGGNGGMWETRLEELEKNERNAQQCRLICIRAVLALFATAFPPTEEAVTLLSHFTDDVLRAFPEISSSQFIRWLKKSKDILVAGGGANSKNNNNNNNSGKNLKRSSPNGTAPPSPNLRDSALVPASASFAAASDHALLSANASFTAGSVLSGGGPDLPWDCFFLQMWLRSELGVTARSHQQWCELPAQRRAGWKYDASVLG